LPYSVVTGANAAIGIAMINVLGNLGTFTGPYALGWLSDQTQSFAAGLTCLGAVSGFAAMLLLLEKSHDESR
jgi:ACS family tartrate transporter-like MFS transporter